MKSDFSRYVLSGFLAASASFAAVAQAADNAGEVVVYSSRNEQLIKPVFDRYTQETGVNITFITDKEGPLLARLQSEGARTPADVLLTVDAGTLWQATEMGLLQPVASAALHSALPTHLRDDQDRWFSLSLRARTIFFNPAKVSPEALSTYEDLADPKWMGKLCLRTSKKVYNQSLVAMMIDRLGEPKTEEVVKGWVANLATSPFSDDTKMLEAIAAGQCQVGIANTYYYGRLKKKVPDASVSIFWPDQQDGQSGVHINVAGAGVVKHARHKEEAVKLIEWMASASAQNLFVDDNMEFPANPQAQPSEAIRAWGEFRASTQPLVRAGQLQAQAVQLMDRVGYK